MDGGWLVLSVVAKLTIHCMKSNTIHVMDFYKNDFLMLNLP